MEERYAIEADGIVKTYPLYDRKKDRLAEAFSLTGKTCHRDFEALRGVTFRVKPGECVGIIGMNGAGKSTLLKILAGIMPPGRGTVRVRGRVSALLELGAGFVPEYTGLENIFLYGMMQGRSREAIRGRMQEILDFADIGDFIGLPVRTYSTGMFVRLAFAAAVAVSPDILLIDEALSVGDVFFQQKCYRRIRELTREATVMMVSHDMNALTKFCGRMLLLNHGVLVFDGDPLEARREYYRLAQGRGEDVPVTLADTHAEGKRTCKCPDESGSGCPGDPPLSSYREADGRILSGKMDVRILRYAYAVNGELYASSCTQGDLVSVWLQVFSSFPVAGDELIVGYQVFDLKGCEIFGETSVTSGWAGKASDHLPAGTGRISFRFYWPLVRDGNYFITPGIGIGKEVLCQVEQCWANHAIHLESSSGGTLVYGLFNQKMEDFRITGDQEKGEEKEGDEHVAVS